MNNIKFYTIFSIFNILLVVFIISGIYILTYLLGSTGKYENQKALIGLILYITYMTLKLFLPKIIMKLSTRYKGSVINRFVEFIRSNPQQKKTILLLAFCFDLPSIFLFIHRADDYSINTLYWCAVLFFILYAGGIILFYLMLYLELKAKTEKMKQEENVC